MFAFLIPAFDFISALAWPSVLGYGIFKIWGSSSNQTAQPAPGQTTWLEWIVAAALILSGLYAIRLVKEIL